MTEPMKPEGVLVGLACGDALGRPVEFRSADWIEQHHGRVTEMLGHGSHNQPAGTITDDSEMALCIARSLVQEGAFDPVDIAHRFCDWYQSGPFDIGMMTADALRLINQGMAWDEAGQRVYEQRVEGQNAGNGSVMRCAPLAVAFADDDETLKAVSRDSSRITHADPRCTYGCAVLNLVIAGYLNGEDTPLESAVESVKAAAPREVLDALEPVIDEDASPELEASGYVVHTLQASLSLAVTAPSAEEAIISAVNMGGDTDTIGAVTGAIAGARFGAERLPDRWLSAITETQELRELAQKFATRAFED